MTFVRALYCASVWDENHKRHFFKLGQFLPEGCEGEETSALRYQKTDKTSNVIGKI